MGLYDTSSPCCDCGRETNHNDTDEAEWYMVWDHVWSEALKHGHAVYLCIGCLETRLGRQLTATDFSDTAGTNFMPERFLPSPRLQDRLKGVKFNEAKYRAQHGL